MKQTAKQASSKLHDYASKEKALLASRFFKTQKGEYGYGDQFIGVTVPNIRKVVKEFTFLSNKEVIILLKSKIHEKRLLALLIWVEQFKRASSTEKKVIYQLYLKNKKYINNWDLVDTSARDIVGSYLENQNRQILYKLVKANSIWDRRIAIISTFHFIKQSDFKDTLKICNILLADQEDLIHKACGWMLREIGKKDQKILIQFLDQNSHKMPRTMLRYAIEKLSPREIRKYMQK